MSDVTMKKVYPGLAEVDRTFTYHLGHYEVDFPDGALGFQLHARLCTDTSCLCDNLSIDWLAGDRVTHSWYTAEHEWQDAQHKPMPDELVGVFNIVEKTEAFQERYSHLVFLRRRQVLLELKRLEGSFSVNLPADLVDEEADPVKQTLGQVRPGAKGGKSLPYAIEFCGDAECFCNNLFVAVIDGAETTSFCVDPKNKWSAMEGTAESTRLLERVQPRLSKSDIFGRQLTFLRTERLLHNYHRYVTHYQETHRIGI